MKSEADADEVSSVMTFDVLDTATRVGRVGTLTRVDAIDSVVVDSVVVDSVVVDSVVVDSVVVNSVVVLGGVVNFVTCGGVVMGYSDI